MKTESQIMKKNSKTIILAMIMALISSGAIAQGLHPYKQKFADMQTWAPTAPKDINFKNFRPYRAVYGRTYTNARGEKVNDQIIMSAQYVYWYGKRVILFEYHDVGAKDFPDTNARTQFYYLDEKTLQMYMAVGPKAGTPQDYTSVRVLEDKITTSRLNTSTGEVDFKELKTSAPSFGFRQLRFLMWGAMDLEVGKKIKLQPIYNAPSAQSTLAVGIVTDQVDYTMPDKKNKRPFIVENTNNPSSAIMHQFHIINEAPYVLAQGLYNADQKKVTSWWLKLQHFEYLDEK